MMQSGWKKDRALLIRGMNLFHAEVLQVIPIHNGLTPRSANAINCKYPTNDEESLFTVGAVE
jgi:hypothetical protein